MRRVTPFIPSSLETCAPPLEGAYVRAPTNHVARGHTRPIRASNRGCARMYPVAVVAPRLWAPSAVCAPRPTRPTRPTAVRAPRPFAPPRSRPMWRLRPPSTPPRRSCPPLRAPRDVHAHGSCSRPTACAPLEYKFIKIVVHSTTWASRPSTTVRWMTAGYLGGDHSFLIHSHRPRAHPRTRLYACLI
jgi:hypothetical protein